MKKNSKLMVGILFCLLIISTWLFFKSSRIISDGLIEDAILFEQEVYFNDSTREGYVSFDGEKHFFREMNIKEGTILIELKIVVEAKEILDTEKCSLIARCITIFYHKKGYDSIIIRIKEVRKKEEIFI